MLCLFGMESTKPKSTQGGSSKKKEEKVVNATPGEVEQALSALTTEQMARLQKTARVRGAALAKTAPDRASEDLLQEALLRALDGRRSWPKNKIGFYEFLCGSMKSISFDWRKKVKSRPEGSLERPRDFEGDDNLPDWIERIPSDANSVEENLTNKEAVHELFDYFKDDEDVTFILEGCFEGLEKNEIAQMGMEEAKFKAADRRLRRGAIEIAERKRKDV